MLKGSDVRIRTISEQAGLVTCIKILYDSGSTSDEAGNDVLVDDVLNMEEFDERGEECAQDLKAQRRYFSNASDEDDNMGEMEKSVDPTAVHWVTKITDTNHIKSQYIVYGNVPSIAHVYENAVLFVHVPAFGE
ncbi:hypothetical protein K438DRAFT_1768540 [Mycena galopus ATCC 62051]|nr:hypothetical protein K438DRAFT_1768540 [Mycena galopus ATCC 62051]